MTSTFNARNAEVYEQSMGRWSRRLAEGFIAFAGLNAGDRVLDVGCGTGSLAFRLANAAEGVQVTGIDASPIYVAAARQRIGDAHVVIEQGDACALPFADASFDRAMTQLVLQFIPDARQAVAEMRRVVRPGGTVAAAVWNSGGGMVAHRMFFDTAAMLDPAAATLRAHYATRPMTRRGELGALWRSLGLAEVVEDSVAIWMDHPSFADYWAPIAAGEGTLGKYVSALVETDRARLEHHLRAAFENGQPDGPRSFAAVAWVCRGLVPG
ncbi:MAG: class I SAM-dependent methyltransferase [Acetobacteraceae bacterium]